MKSIDAFTHIGYAGVNHKKPQNEDRLFVGERIFAVVDGVTAITPLTKYGLNAASYAAAYVVSFLQEQDARAHEDSMGDILLKANDSFGLHLQKEWPEMWALGKRGTGAVVAAIKIHKDQNTMSFAGVGDCVCIIETTKGPACLIRNDDAIVNLENRFIHALDEKLHMGLSITEARQLPDVKKIIEANRDERNKSYGVFGGEGTMKPFLKTGTIPMQDLQTVTLFSDGLIWPEAETLEGGLFNTAQFMKEEGIQNYHIRLKNIFDQDHTFQKHKRLKHMDDATGIVISF